MSRCTTFRHEENLDPDSLYVRRLLEPGWAGFLALAEAEYIRDCLERDGALRRRWAIRRKKVPLSLIAERAFVEDPVAARRHIAAEQARARRKSLQRSKCRRERTWSRGTPRTPDEISGPGSRL